MLSFGAKSAPRWLVKTIIKAADKTGVDPVYLMTLADVESSLEPQAKAPTSSAEGLFQFIDQTWLETVHVHAATHGFAKAAEALRTVGDEVVLTDEGKRSWLLGLKRDPYFRRSWRANSSTTSNGSCGPRAARTRRGGTLSRAFLRREGRRSVPPRARRAAGRGRRQALSEGRKGQSRPVL